MEFKGTKGKWQTKHGDVYSDVQDDNDAICDVYNWRDIEGEANALLISKAPEILEKLKECTEKLPIESDKQVAFYQSVIELIKSATELS